MRSFYMRIFKNIICIYVLVLCCFAYATMIQAIPGHVYVQEGQKHCPKTGNALWHRSGSGRFRQ